LALITILHLDLIKLPLIITHVVLIIVIAEAVVVVLLLHGLWIVDILLIQLLDILLALE
jgi:hypothetical protein